MKRLQIGLLASSGSALAALSGLAHRSLYFPIDLQVSLWMQKFDGLLLPAMHAASFAGSLIPATVIVVSLAIWLGKTNRRLEAILTGSSNVISSLAIVPAIKLLVARPRPTADLIQVMTASSWDSFPSGHVAYAVVCYGFLCYLLPSLSGNKAVVRTLRALLAVLIGLTFASRIYLGAHWLSDALGGLFLGGLVLTGTVIIYCHYLPRFSKRGQNA
ncbi:MAG TPA: phosphatase PAP2 family protein [Dehalococcoidia bacterium]|nr:phosphatase PAP2 family protein [Dehalococcoidia bacterium]